MTSTKTFEQKLAHATKIVEEIEVGELTLDELMKKHKEGRTLIEESYAILKQAEEEFIAATEKLNEQIKEEEK